MSLQDLLNIIQNGENQTVEFKSSFNVGLIETIVAFANTQGGRVLVGVKDNGQIEGVTTVTKRFKIG